MAQSKQQRRCSRLTSLAAALLIACFSYVHAAAQDIAGAEPAPLQLEVTVNGFPLNLIGAFALLPDGKIGSPRSELVELGVAVGSDGPPEEIIPLDTIAGLSYVYDDEMQSIELEIKDSARLAKGLSGKGDAEFIEATSGTGAVANYTVYGSASYNAADDVAALNGGSLSYDLRAFSRFGTIQHTGVFGTTTFEDVTALRYDTVWSYADQKRALSYRLGDIISGGLNWTRPVRLGGGQVQRNFGIRPDLITMPLPLIEGSAAVPSALDVYIDGVKAYSSKVQEGPFTVDDIPVFTNSGTVRVVLTDPSGREVESESEFSTSPELLKRDLYDFSIEAGLLRRDYGVESFGYGDEPAVLGSLRYGIADIITGEAHAEAGLGLWQGGAGFVLNAGDFGLFNGAVAASTFEGAQGYFVQAGWEAQFGNLGLSASVSRTFGEFKDLAAVSESSGRKDKSSGVPLALDRLSVTYSIPEYKSGFGVSFIHQLAEDRTRSLLLSGSYTQNLANDITFFVNAFADFGDEEEYGAFAGISMPLGGSITGTAGGAILASGIEATAEASKPFDDGDLPVAWRVAHTEGNTRQTSASAAARTSKALIEGNVTHQEGSIRANAAVDGAVVFAGGSLMAGRKINDSFAVVDVGAAGVPVEYENRFAGKTGKNGKILLANLNSFQKNKIAIDVADLPLAADVGETEIVVVPREMAGVVVNFGVNTEQQAALVILTDDTGTFLPESSEVLLEGASEPFITGYDGQVYLTGIGGQNRLVVKYGGKECQAIFAFDPQDDSQAVIGPLKCT